MYLLHKTIVLVGMMGAGKTAVGNALAKALGTQMRDSDEEIVKASGQAISEIFERDGEDFFRAREREVIARLLAGPPCVLSTGGGAYLFEANRQAIARAGVAVWLKADPELLWQRVRHKTTRPLLRTENPRETLFALHAARVAHYAKAEIIVESQADFSVEVMASHVLAAIAKRADVLEVV